MCEVRALSTSESSMSTVDGASDSGDLVSSGKPIECRTRASSPRRESRVLAAADVNFATDTLLERGRAWRRRLWGLAATALQVGGPVGTGPMDCSGAKDDDLDRLVFGARAASVTATRVSSFSMVSERASVSCRTSPNPVRAMVQVGHWQRAERPQTHEGADLWKRGTIHA